MADSDFNPKWPTPDMSAATNGLTAASKTMQAFIDEMGQMTQKNFAQTSKIIADLQAARSLGDLLAIQSKFVQETFEAFNERLHRMSALMAELPAELSQSGQQVTQTGTEIAKEAMTATADAVAKTAAAVQEIGAVEPPKY